MFFTWSNAFGVRDNVSTHNMGFEKASVLFNLGAIYSRLGVNCGTKTDEAIKKAAVYFQVFTSKLVAGGRSIPNDF
jgi:programmed cell death 6-interacting protein